MPTRSKPSNSVDGLIKKAAKKAAAPTKAVWAGPSGEGPNGGITFSLLSRFLVCRERFRLLVVEGLRPRDKFNPKLEFGNMWHAMEEALAEGKPTLPALAKYANELVRRYQMDRDDIGHWTGMAAEFFPRYVEHWAKHPDVTARFPLLQEEVFDVPYLLPSGRTVRLRGKWDSVDLIGEDAEAGVYLQENKTKSRLDGETITRQCTFDLQTMLYAVAYLKWAGTLKPADWLDLREKAGVSTGVRLGGAFRGTRYNVVRRPAHKTVASAAKTYEELKEAGRLGEWFGRWKIKVGPADIEKFRRTCLDPILENLSDWWEWINHPGFGQAAASGAWIKTATLGLHWRHPFGVYNVLDEGGHADLDAYLETGSTVGLERATDLFPELTK